MPVHSRASIRYANAVVMAAEKTDVLKTLRNEAEGLISLADNSQEFRAFLANPTIAMERKLSLVKAMFSDRVSPLMSRFLEMLIRKYREALLPEIMVSTLAILDEKEGRVVAEVSSAIELDDRQQTNLAERLQTLTGKTVTLETRVDPDIEAGFVARVGEKVYDASLSAQLNRMHRQLVDADLRDATQ